MKGCLPCQDLPLAFSISNFLPPVGWETQRKAEFLCSPKILSVRKYFKHSLSFSCCWAAAAAVPHAVSLYQTEKDRGIFSFQHLLLRSVLHHLLSAGRAVAPVPLLFFPREMPSMVSTNFLKILVNKEPQTYFYSSTYSTCLFLGESST